MTTETLIATSNFLSDINTNVTCSTALPFLSLLLQRSEGIPHEGQKIHAVAPKPQQR